MLYSAFILLSYAFLGGGIKYADQAYDIGVFSKRKANLLAVPGAVLMAYLVIFDPPSTVIFFSVLLVVALSRKIDNTAFYVGTGILLSLPLIFGSLGVNGKGILEISWLPFTVLIFSGVVDELGNNWADERRRFKRKNNLRNGVDDSLPKSIGEAFFEYRLTMKIAVLSLVVADFFPNLYFFAFLLFDLMYFLVEWHSFHIKYYSLTKPTLITTAVR